MNCQRTKNGFKNCYIHGFKNRVHLVIFEIATSIVLKIIKGPKNGLVIDQFFASFHGFY